MVYYIVELECWVTCKCRSVISSPRLFLSLTDSWCHSINSIHIGCTWLGWIYSSFTHWCEKNMNNHRFLSRLRLFLQFSLLLLILWYTFQVAKFCQAKTQVKTSLWKLIVPILNRKRNHSVNIIMCKAHQQRMLPLLKRQKQEVLNLLKTNSYGYQRYTTVNMTAEYQLRSDPVLNI